MLTESNLENLDEDDIDASGQMDTEKMVEPSEGHYSNKERSLPSLRKVNTMPLALHKRGE